MIFHALPTVNHNRIFLKLSLTQAQSGAPSNDRRRPDDQGYENGLPRVLLAVRHSGSRPGARIPAGAAVRTAVGPSLSRGPSRPFLTSDQPCRSRAGGLLHVRRWARRAVGERYHSASRLEWRALLERAVAEKPHAIVANGDHVYWDLLSPVSSSLGASPAGIAFAGTFDRTKPVLGSANEDFLLKAAGEQIAPLYGTVCRSIPVFFVRDDHDYFDNDTASDRLITFPPTDHMMRLAQATQQLYYPEFLPDPNRPSGTLRYGRARTGTAGVSQSYGTLRYGDLLEVLLYDNRRTGTMHGPTAVFVDPEVEKWLTARRMRGPDTIHVVNAPGLPPGWTKGNWYWLYSDRIENWQAGRRHVQSRTRQPGWLAQHDRLIEAMHRNGRSNTAHRERRHSRHRRRAQSSRCGRLDLSSNPVVSVLPGPVGTDGTAWPRAVEHPPPARCHGSLGAR